MLTALACDGHVLLEDVPGTAKTVLARAIAGSIEGAIPQRIQCTPDLQPTDVTGLSVFDQQTREFEFRPGPIFANVVLVDEINRATPKTQSALLEAMAEQQVTVDGVTRELPYPFLLLATENPIEYEGTFPLPEAQLDRFFLRTALGYPGIEDELRILDEQRYAHPLDALEPVVGLDEVQELRAAAQHVYVDDVAPPLDRRARARDARAGVGRRSGARCAAASRSSAPPARGRLLDGRELRRPRGHRAAVRPGARPSRRLHARLRRPCARDAAGSEAIEEFRGSCLELAPQPGSEEDPLFEGGVRPASCTTSRSPGVGRSTDLPARSPAPGDRAVVRDDEEPPARLRHGRRGLAPVPAGRRHGLDRLGGVGAALDRARARTSSSSASGSPRRRRGSSSSATGGRRWRCYGPPLPWLDKPEAMRTVVELVLASAGAAGGFVGYLDYADGEPHWRQPKGERKLIELRDERLWSTEYGGPADWLERSIDHLATHTRAVTPGTFVFLLSDFIPSPSDEVWLAAIEHRWDVVPIVIQDPTWEQSFPDVDGIVVPLRDPRGGPHVVRAPAAERGRGAPRGER